MKTNNAMEKTRIFILLQPLVSGQGYLTITFEFVARMEISLFSHDDQTRVHIIREIALPVSP